MWNRTEFQKYPRMKSKIRSKKCLQFLKKRGFSTLLYTQRLTCLLGTSTSFMRNWHYFSWQNGFPRVNEGRFSNDFLNCTLSIRLKWYNPIQSKFWLDIFHSQTLHVLTYIVHICNAKLNLKSNYYLCKCLWTYTNITTV